jgi:hypothetical protein
MKNKTATLKSQQGDVILRKLPAMPDGKRERIAKGRCILAHGESGHSHVVEDDTAELTRIGARMLLEIFQPAAVVHEEHKQFTLAPGVWEVGRVREFDYLTKMARPVQD